MSRWKVQEPCLRSLPVEAWPEADQAAFVANRKRTRSPFRDRGGGRDSAAATVEDTWRGYGRLLAYLRRHRSALLAVPPADRLSDDLIADYRDFQLAFGLADRTVVCNAETLQRALRWMFPARDWTFVTRPFGKPLLNRRPILRRQGAVPGEASLRDFVRDLFERGIAEPQGRRRWAMVRDAALLGILLSLAPRIATVARLQLGRHVRKIDDAWWVDQASDITKTGRHTGLSLDLPLDPEAGAWLERYIAVEREEMAAALPPAPALWLSCSGQPMAFNDVRAVARRRSTQHFGSTFGSHAFWRSLATTDSLGGNVSPFDAMLRLGHTSVSVTLAHYNKAQAHAAGRRHAERLGRKRREMGIDVHATPE